MARFTHSFTVNSEIETVWRFYTDISHLKKITPKKMGLEILEADGQEIRQGAKCTLEANIFGKSRWQATITRLEPYEYVDEMSGGRFKSWRHLHRFRNVGSGKTEIIDEIDFELPLGFLGKMFERYALKSLAEVFEYRKRATIQELCQNSQV